MALENIVEMLLVLLLSSANIGVSALRGVTVSVPPAVRIMDTVTLSCDYDLEGEPLYTVKWYKAGKEFFRYVPKELPNTRVFALPGIDVDLSRSSPKKVVLRNVQPEVTGKYKCEVSTDSPNFYTFDKAGYMYVIDVPFEDPKLSVDKELFEISYTLRGNCSSPPSFPAANITWFLNGKKLNNSHNFHLPSPSLTIYNTRRSPVTTFSTIEIEIGRNTFRAGKAILSCMANIFDVYQKEVEAILEEERPKPRPSSVLGTRDVTANSCARKSVSVLVFLLVILLR